MSLEVMQDSGLRASDQLLAAQNLVLEMIASGARLDSVLRALAAYIDQQEPAGMCSIFLLDPDGCTLRLGATAKLPESLADPLAKLLGSLDPIGEMRAVAEVDEVLRRKRDQALVENRETAYPGVEDRDRKLAPGAPARDGHERAKDSEAQSPSIR